MSQFKNIQEALEACRPGSRDIDLPEMAELRARIADDPQVRTAYEQAQREDAAIARAFGQVPVPEGLEQRLLATLEAAAAASEHPPSEVGEPAAPSGPVVRRARDELEQQEVASGGKRKSRRWWLAAALVIPAVLLLTASFWWPARTPTHAELAGLAQSWTERTLKLDADADWYTFDEEQFPTLPWRTARWRTLRTPLDPNAVVFDLPTRPGQRLLVYRLQTNRDLQLPAVPYQMLSTTGKWRIAAWQETQYVYIAVTNRPELLEGFRTGLAFSFSP